MLRQLFDDQRIDLRVAGKSRLHSMSIYESFTSIAGADFQRIRWVSNAWKQKGSLLETPVLVNLPPRGILYGVDHSQGNKLESLG
jgi:hypothetical protein